MHPTTAADMVHRKLGLCGPQAGCFGFPKEFSMTTEIAFVGIREPHWKQSYLPWGESNKIATFHFSTSRISTDTKCSASAPSPKFNPLCHMSFCQRAGSIDHFRGFRGVMWRRRSALTLRLRSNPLMVGVKGSSLSHSANAWAETNEVIIHFAPWLISCSNNVCIALCEVKKGCDLSISLHPFACHSMLVNPFCILTSFSLMLKTLLLMRHLLIQVPSMQCWNIDKTGL